MNRPTTLQLVALAGALLLSPLSAFSGGPFEPPDGVGNLSGRDYTGFRVYGWVLGLENRIPGTHTKFVCMNLGLIAADDIIVQVYDQNETVSRAPRAEVLVSLNLPLSDVDEGNTNNLLAGAIPNGPKIGRIIYRAPPRLTPAIKCEAYIVDGGSGRSVAELPITRPAPPKKKKKKRR